MDQRRGFSFEEIDVVANYRYRPPYPDAVFRKLLAIPPRSEHLLDIGCGPGKISRPLSGSFASVTAVDPSAHMIALGRSLPGGGAENIRWIESFAEDFPTDGQRFDLTVAAASIHWMDHARLFPHLLANAAPGHVMAARTSYRSIASSRASRISSPASIRATPSHLRNSAIVSRPSTRNSLNCYAPIRMMIG